MDPPRVLLHQAPPYLLPKIVYEKPEGQHLVVTV